MELSYTYRCVKGRIGPIILFYLSQTIDDASNLTKNEICKSLHIFYSLVSSAAAVCDDEDCVGFQIFNYFIIKIQSSDQHDAKYVEIKRYGEILNDIGYPYLVKLVVMRNINVLYNEHHRMRTNNFDCTGIVVQFGLKTSIVDLWFSFHA